MRMLNKLAGRESVILILVKDGYPASACITDAKDEHYFALVGKQARDAGYELVQHPNAEVLNGRDLMTWLDAWSSIRGLTEGEGEITCDWGGCGKLAVAERLSSTAGWLPVCEEHKVE